MVYFYTNDLGITFISEGNTIRLSSDDDYESSPYFSYNEKIIEFQLKPETKVPVRRKRPEGYKFDN